jgi:hypothetical protein
VLKCKTLINFLVYAKNLFGGDDLDRTIKLYQEMEKAYQKVKNILGKTSYKQYLKKSKGFKLF